MYQSIIYWKSSNRWLVSFEFCVIEPVRLPLSSQLGCFNLDPNRVLDIILESFETRPEQNKLFIGLLKAYMPNGTIICEVLGYKYRHFSDTKTPSSLYVITALLLQSKIICLDDIYSWVMMKHAPRLNRTIELNFALFLVLFAVKSNR